MLTLAPEATASWTFNATAPSVGTYGIHITAQGTFASPTALGNGVSNAVDLSVPVSPGPTDIQVTGSSNNGSPPVGSQFKYTFQVKNNGPQTAYGVTFDDALPPSLPMVGFSSDIAACSAGSAANSVHCGDEVLGVGQQATITIIAVANTTGSITDMASIGNAWSRPQTGEQHGQRDDPAQVVPAPTSGIPPAAGCRYRPAAVSRA